MANYSLTFNNQSTNSSTFIIYQGDPAPGAGMYSLVWLAAKVHPNSQAVFTWALDYGFVWGNSTDLQPGKIFDTAQELPADLSTTNAITLAYQNGTPLFTNQRSGPAGSLSIVNAADLPMNTAAEGISMAQQATFVIEAQPNMQVIFTPAPQYWIAFGDFKEGEILDSDLMFKTSADIDAMKTIYGPPIQVRFPLNVYSVTAILNADDSWTIASS